MDVAHDRGKAGLVRRVGHDLDVVRPHVNATVGVKARALAVEPKVLLLDEPFGALDAKVRKELRRWLRQFHDEIGLTTIFVTHDQEEALEIADQVVIMNNARIEQVGTPQEVYDRPASPFVYQFLGNVNVLKAQALADSGTPAPQGAGLHADGRVYVRGKPPAGEFARVRILGHTDYDLIAEPA